MDKVIAEIFSSGLNSPPPHGSCTMFYEINIYQSGKIEISTYSNDRWGNTPKSIFLKIDDNIPIPEYIIELFKMLFNNGDIYNYHILEYIKVLQKFKEDFSVIYKKNSLQKEKIIEDFADINKKYSLQIEELNKENHQLKLQIEHLKKENEELKLQIRETKINHIINYYC
jgi:hypothetical protein